MRAIINFLALIGLLVTVGIGFALYHGAPYLHAYRSMDARAIPTFLEAGKTWIETGDVAEATAWKFPVKEGLTVQDVEQVLLSVAAERNFAKVGEKPLSGQIEKLTGKAYRFVKIYEFCNALTAARMLDYSDAFAAHVPCRITLIEDRKGKLWLITMNLDLLVHGGKQLPPRLKREAEGVRDTMLELARRGANGEF
jgi:hypothetical protein